MRNAPVAYCSVPGLDYCYHYHIDNTEPAEGWSDWCPVSLPASIKWLSSMISDLVHPVQMYLQFFCTALLGGWHGMFTLVIA